jgi:hypothetical protein
MRLTNAQVSHIHSRSGNVAVQPRSSHNLAFAQTRSIENQDTVVCIPHQVLLRGASLTSTTIERQGTLGVITFFSSQKPPGLVLIDTSAIATQLASALPFTMATTNQNVPSRFQPFRFLDLPVELRLMVYEQLPRTVKHTHIRNLSDTDNDRNDFKLILITRHVPTSILATCREVQAEANSIIRKLVRSFILENVPKVVESGVSKDTLCELIGVISVEYHAMDVSRSHCIALRDLD